MKFNFEEVENCDTGLKRDVTVKMWLPVKTKDLLIGTIPIILGIGYLTCKAFVKGAVSYQHADLEALKGIDCIQE